MPFILQLEIKFKLNTPIEKNPFLIDYFQKWVAGTFPCACM